MVTLDANPDKLAKNGAAPTAASTGPADPRRAPRPEGRPPEAPPSMPPYPHEHEFSVITVGTGSPDLSLERACACTMIQHKGSYYVVDAGPGVITSFLRAEPAPVGPGVTATAYRWADIAAVLLTHLHQDHTNDYFDVMTYRWVTGGRRVQVVGPPGTQRLHDFLVDFYRDDLAYRWLRDRSITEEGMFTGVDVREITGVNRFGLDEMVVTTAELTHTMYDLGYRFEVNARSIVVSGDTAYDARLIDLARDADILVADCNPLALGPSPPMRPLTDLPEEYLPRGRYRGDPTVPAHAPLRDVIAMARDAGVGKLVCTHLMPTPFDEAATRERFAAGGFEGDVVFGVDGLEIVP